MSEYETLNVAHYVAPSIEMAEGPAPFLDWIDVKRLVVDKSYQRDISRAGAANIQRIADQFEWSKFSPVIVAPIEGGLFSIIDGQHRATAALLRGVEKVPCEIVHIDRARQAEAFAAINGNTTRVTPQAVYFARLTGKDQTAQEMEKILAAAGVTVARANRTLRDMKKGETGAVAALFKLKKLYGPETLISALQCVCQAGNGNPGFLRATVIEGICVALHRNIKWRESGERLLRAMDDFDFIQMWDLAIARRSSVPKVTAQDVVAELVTEHLSHAMSGKKKAA